MSPTKETTLSEYALLRLPDDTLSEILLACDPEDALRMAQTCKIMHLLSDSKRLWITLLAKLDYDQAPDVGPHVDLDSLQAKEVKRIIVRALRNYNNWCSADGPRATREQEVQLERHQLFAVKVLPGCQYLFVQPLKGDYFGLWDINRDTLVASYHYNRSLQYTPRDCALLKGGKIARAAVLLDSNPYYLEVVDFDLNCGHATLLFSGSLQDVTNARNVKVREEAVAILSHNNIALLNPETGKIAMVTVESDSINFEIVRNTLICLEEAVDGKARLLVAKLSRIFEQTQGTTERIPLKDICAICRVLTFLPDFTGGRYTLTVSNPIYWGSGRPCRILLTHMDYCDSNIEGNKMVRVHRLYLEESNNDSELALTYDSSSNWVQLEGSSSGYLAPTQPSISGRWMLTGGNGQKNEKYDIMLHRLWEDDVRLSPSDTVPSAMMEEVERFSGTEIWYLDGGNCVLHFFD